MWEIGTTGRMALPTHVDRVVALRAAPTTRAAVRGRDAARGGAASTPRSSTSDGRVRVRLEGYRTIELPGGVDPDALAPIRTAMADARP